MTTKNRTKSTQMKVLLSFVMIVFIFGGCASTSNNPDDSALLSNCRKSHEILSGVSWVQTSVEYRFACYQVFSHALKSLEQGLSDINWTAAIEQTGGYQSLPPAIIVDVDETILDNSPFQARLVSKGINFNQDMWRNWVQETKAIPMPGAKEFLSSVRDLGVHVFYITNRELEAPTVKNLQLAIDAKITANDVLCKKELDEWGSDKTSRRAEIVKTHRVILLVGDDYNDFAFLGKVTPAERIEKAFAHQSRWGKQWFILSNPIYGNFEKALYNYDYSLTDAQKLAAKYGYLRTDE